MRNFFIRIVLLGLSLLLIASAALAQHNAAMTEEELYAVWQASFDKMDTTGDFDITDEEELAQLEKYYTEQTGLERKEDLIISSLPGEDDMPYEEALAFAKQALKEEYGVSEDELDAMGVYPRFMDYVYMEDESEWEFFFSSLTGTNISQDHDIPASGEYLVTFTSQSREVLLCVRYLPKAGISTSEALEARALARQAALEASKMSEADFSAYYQEGNVYCFDGEDVYTVLIYAKTADTPDGDGHVYQVNVGMGDDGSLSVLDLDYTDGVG